MSDADREKSLARFFAKVDKTGDCWVWTACGYGPGYGGFFFDGKTGYAHRFAYATLVGPIPDGLEIDHLCRNRRCVNPAHLEPVTRRENVLRGQAGSAINARRTECALGHAFTAENTRVVLGESGYPNRVCRACHRRLVKESRRRRREIINAELAARNRA